MAKKSITQNYLYNTAYQLLTVITPFITMPYIARVLGADKIGIVSYSESLVSLFSLFAVLGINTYGQRETSYVQDRKDELSGIFWNTKILQFITSSVVLVCYLIFAFFQNNKSLYFVLSFNILAIMFDVTWFFQGIEEFGKIAGRNIISRILSIIYIFVFVKKAEDYILYAFGMAFTTFLGNILLWFSIPNYINTVKKNNLNPFHNFNTVFSLFIPTIAIQIYTVFDKTMIGIITKDSFQNGYYEQSMRIIRIALMIFSSMGAVIIPRIGNYYHNNGDKELKLLLYRSYRFVWMLAVPMCIGMIIISNLFVPWFYGEGYNEVIPLLCILSFLFVAIGINSVTGMQYLVPVGKQNIFTITVIMGACVNFILNMILIPLFAAIGASIASVIAEGTIAVLQVVIVRKEISAKIIIKQGINYFISGFFMLIVLVFVTRTISANFIGIFITILMGIIVYGTILFLLKDEFMIKNCKNITKLMLKKLKV